MGILFAAIRKLENAVLKMYVVNAVVNGKTDKLNEFFTRLAPELQGQTEWKDWFCKLSSPFHLELKIYFYFITLYLFQ